jgi:hypothetical protein
MILPLHILIALASVVFTSYVFFVPSKLKLQISYALVGLTLASGTVLVVTSPAHMLQACVSGIVYVSVVSVAILAVRQKLARLTA